MSNHVCCEYLRIEFKLSNERLGGMMTALLFNSILNDVIVNLFIVYTLSMAAIAIRIRIINKLIDRYPMRLERHLVSDLSRDLLLQIKLEKIKYCITKSFCIISVVLIALKLYVLKHHL